MSHEHYSVEVGGDHLIFASGHFISFAGHQCERLHGHNYRASIRIYGSLNEDCYVVDFIALLRLAKVITDRLDHHMLLPATNPVIRVIEHDSSYRVQYQDRVWQFPANDCVILPIENTTAELIARYIGVELLDSLLAELSYSPLRLEVTVEEGVGVQATYFWSVE